MFESWGWEKMMLKGRVALPAIAAVLVTIVGLDVGPADAKVLRGTDISPYEFSYEDCGFTVDGAGLFSSPKSMARVGSGEDTSAFFGHDNYTITETHTRRDTGAAVVISVHGLLHDVRATHIEGSVFEFTMIDVAHVEFLDPDGMVLGRENGRIQRVFLFDTLGDDTPGGLFLELLREDFRGNFGDFDICTALGAP